MKKLSLILILPLCVASAPSMAQVFSLTERGAVPTAMPPGSHDFYVGAAIANLPEGFDGGPHRTVSAPLIHVQWSNGIFFSNGMLGMQLSNSADAEYGPIVLGSVGREPDDKAQWAGTHSVKGTPNVGGFYGYRVGDQTRVVSNLVYNTSGHGLTGSVNLERAWPSLAPHHAVSVSLGVAFAGSAVMRQLYDVDGLYHTSGGVTAVDATVNWNWALSNEWLIVSSAMWTRLGSKAGNSPAVDRRNYGTWFSGLAYRF